MKKKMHGVMALLVVLLTVGGLGALYAVPPAAPAPAPVAAPLALETRAARRAETVVPVFSQGRARASRRVPLSLEVSGRVVETVPALADGGRVTRGQVLLRLDPEPFELAVTRRLNDVQAARLHLARSRAQASVAKGRNSVATPLARHEPQLEEARGRLAAAEAGLREARRQREQAVLRAPFDGVLEAVSVETGQHVQAGGTLGRLLGLARVEVRLPVRDDWLALLGIDPGDGASLASVTVTLTGRFAGRDGVWPARLARREGGINRNRMASLIAVVDNRDAPLPLEPGVFVRAELTGPPLAGVAVLPAAARAGDDTVWVVDTDQRLRRQPVTILHSDAGHLYLSEAPRRPVVMAGGRPLLEGMRIQPRPAADTVSRAGEGTP
ncbi:efflux RND transporter periplasmic adaptor subunit [Alloalcanivorax sp. C16-1]|uniref:efflux RND transporter periplasmic adaptor subunit n=1 Tax=Alloalcanivorax sp. C16-1 TaxID=3390051 RepID=UPI0039704EE6